MELLRRGPVTRRGSEPPMGKPWRIGATTCLGVNHRIGRYRQGTAQQKGRELPKKEESHARMKPPGASSVSKIVVGRLSSKEQPSSMQACLDRSKDVKGTDHGWLRSAVGTDVDHAAGTRCSRDATVSLGASTGPHGPPAAGSLTGRPATRRPAARA